MKGEAKVALTKLIDVYNSLSYFFKHTNNLYDIIYLLLKQKSILIINALTFYLHRYDKHW